MPDNACEFPCNGIRCAVLTSTGDAVHGLEYPADLLEGGAMG